MGHRFQIRLQDKQPKTLIYVYDFYFLPETETKFIFPFFRGLTKHLRLDSGFRIYPVEAPTTSSMPTYAVAEHNRKLVVSPILMERFDYDVTIINDGGVSEVKNSERLSIDLVEGGSVVSLIRGSKVLFTVPIRDIVEQTILNMEPETT